MIVRQFWLHNKGFSQLKDLGCWNINWTISKILPAHTLCAPSACRKIFQCSVSKRIWESQLFSGPYKEHGLQSGAHSVSTTPSKPQRLRSQTSRLWPQDQGTQPWQRPGPNEVPWAGHGHLSRLVHRVQALGSWLKHSQVSRVLCLREFSCLLLFTVFGAPLEWQAGVLAVDGVMWYVVQLHAVHGLAETCGAALPGEFFPQYGPLRATCVLQAIYESRKPADLPFQASNFFGYFFSID